MCSSRKAQSVSWLHHGPEVEEMQFDSQQGQEFVCCRQRPRPAVGLIELRITWATRRGSFSGNQAAGVWSVAEVKNECSYTSSPSYTITVLYCSISRCRQTCTKTGHHGFSFCKETAQNWSQKMFKRNVAVSCECGNEPSGSIKRGEYLDQLTTC